MLGKTETEIARDPDGAMSEMLLGKCQGLKAVLLKGGHERNYVVDSEATMNAEGKAVMTDRLYLRLRVGAGVDRAAVADLLGAAACRNLAGTDGEQKPVQIADTTVLEDGELLRVGTSQKTIAEDTPADA